MSLLSKTGWLKALNLLDPGIFQSTCTGGNLPGAKNTVVDKRGQEHLIMICGVILASTSSLRILASEDDTCIYLPTGVSISTEATREPDVSSQTWHRINLHTISQTVSPSEI